MFQMGLIKTKRGEFYIEPSKHHAARTDGHPHVLFQRSAVSSDRKLVHIYKCQHEILAFMLPVI